VGFYGGGRRRRKRSSRGGGAFWLWFLGLLLVVGLAVKYWYVAVPLFMLVVIAVVASASQRKHAQAEADRAWAEKEEAEAKQQVIRVKALEKQRVDEQQAWLEGPPPYLRLPGRFTEIWFAANVPGMHPGQVPALLDELFARGWTGERIKQRIAPYLAANQFYLDAMRQSEADHAPSA
jgi:hypothetical protein